MVRKTDEERLRELEEQMEKIKARKQQLEGRLKEKERRDRTKRLIQVGAIFEKHFEIFGPEEAEKIALAFKNAVLKNKEQALAYSRDQLNDKLEEKTKEEVAVK